MLDLRSQRPEVEQGDLDGAEHTGQRLACYESLGGAKFGSFQIHGCDGLAR